MRRRDPAELRFIDRRDSGADEAARWLGRSVTERVEAVELARRATVGIYDRGASRLERVLVLSERAPGGRRRVLFGDVRVNMLGEKELVANKRAAGRPKDLLDLALLAELRPKRRKA